MNKKELFEAVIELPVDYSGSRPEIDKLTTLELIKLLDEPQKVKIPQFVADVIEEAREESSELEDAFEYARDVAFRGEIGEWFMKLQNRNNFARAWLDGYEAEKEKRYIVRLKNIRESHETLNCEKHSKIWNFPSEEETILYKTKHTRKELEEAGFGWVFDCEGIEIEEVTE